MKKFLAVSLMVFAITGCSNPFKYDEEKLEMVLKKGDTVNIVFECQTCGDKQEYQIDEPWAKTIFCKCPEKIDKKGNMKEYFSANIS